MLVSGKVGIEAQRERARSAALTELVRQLDGWRQSTAPCPTHRASRCPLMREIQAFCYFWPVQRPEAPAAPTPPGQPTTLATEQERAAEEGFLREVAPAREAPAVIHLGPPAAEIEEEGEGVQI